MRTRWLGRMAIRPICSAKPCSGVAKQRPETKVHVLLDMAVKQREARLIGDEIHRDASKCGNDYGILHDSGSGFAVDLDEFEQVTVHVQGGRIVAAVVKHEPIAASLAEHKFPLVGIF